MALIAFSDSEVHNDKTCSKTCLKSFETLKTQLDDLRIEFNKSEFILATYKRGLASVEEQLVFYKKNEIEKFDNASKSLDKLIGSQIPDKSRKGLGFVSYNVVPPPSIGLFPPPTLDLSYSGLEEFQQPEFEGYGPKTSKSVSEDISNEVRESSDASLVEELVSNDKLEKKTVFPTVAKINFVRPQQPEKPVRKLVKYAKMYREWVVSGNNYTRVNYNYFAKKAHPSAYRNIVPRAVLMKTGLRPLNTAMLVNTAHPKTTVYSARPTSFNTVKGKVNTARPKVVNTARPNTIVVNAIRANQVNAVKALACWVWRPTKLNSASITFKRHNYVDAQGRSKVIHKKKIKAMSIVDAQAKVLVDAAKENVHTYTRRRRAVSTGSGGISTASRLFSTAEESVSTAGASMPVSIAGIVQEVNISIPSPVVVKDKGKGKMEESEDEQTKRTKLQQEQDRLGHEAAVRLQEELDEEERQRMARVHEATQSFTEEEWENIRARFEADEELSRRLQAEERNKYSEVDQPKMLVDLINQRKKYFAVQKAEAKRNKPMTQAQQRNYMINYIKHMGSHTLQQLKRYSFDELK
ncbi:hypothetical protein Tco_1056672 [Tanacetum coccineum]|uniref:Uncharacterized protein n=1 Tax=Tanacetum coccineum TaxID=301880 RepID=A0ABQ5H3U0_9ASTR